MAEYIHGFFFITNYYRYISHDHNDERIHGPWIFSWYINLNKDFRIGYNKYNSNTNHLIKYRVLQKTFEIVVTT